MSRPISRRKALASAFAFGGTALALAAQVAGERRQVPPAHWLRPPGALREPEFVGACLRCGQCVQDCPFDALRLAGLGQPMAAATPYFVARAAPCAMCETLPCVAACPSGALALADIGRARMGLARLSAPDRCYSYTGAAYCDSCLQACPLEGQAIRLEYGRTARGGSFQPRVDASRCTGCGRCEAACILEGEAAITVAANHETRR